MDYREQWESFLNPEVFRDRIINISMYITIYEMLKDSIISRIKDFYVMTLIGAKDLEGEEEYRLEVLSRHKNHFYASISWLIENEVINEEDKENIEILKSYRNYLAHEMSDIVFNGEIKDLMKNFLCAYQLIHKIENWWIVNFEMAINPDFTDANLEDIDIDNIQSGKKLMIDMALSVLSGSEELLKKFKSN
ncbi:MULTISPECIES: DUF4145 domain-containing protein [unclassified Acinetobacter]|jgi:hypothetical protein|uniref:DUF4145 domain-containing protein n=1 Tax=unclassified Acinetobacter TaxID=196816 RepID=UPI00211E61C6|nr:MULTISPECIES: DUF4145 domain-containing protein [unclassified Acinetobacter]